MAIGAPIAIGNVASPAASADSTIDIVTTADVPAGAWLIVLANVSNNQTFTIADSAGNTYSASTHRQSLNGSCRFFFLQVAVAIPAGLTITITTSATSGNKIGLAFYVTGLVDTSPLDMDGAGASGSTNTPSITTGTPAQADELVLHAIWIAAGASDLYTIDSDLTALDSANTGAASLITRIEYAIISAAAALTFAPAMGTPRSWGQNYVSFKAAAAAAAGSYRSLLGWGR